MTIKYYRKNVYGKELQYILDPKIRSAIKDISGKETLTTLIRFGLQDLGFKLLEVLPPKSK